MSRVPHIPDFPPPGFSRDQLSPGAPAETAGEIASEEGILQQQRTGIPSRLLYSWPMSPAAVPTPGSNMLVDETDKLIEDVHVYQHTDFAYVFNHPNSDSAVSPTFNRSFPGSLGDFELFASYYYTHYRGYRLSIAYNQATKQITIAPRFSKGPGEIELRQSVTRWGGSILQNMCYGPELFLTSEEAHSIQSGIGYKIPFRTDTDTEDEEDENKGKKTAKENKAPDQSYHLSGKLRDMEYPFVVFETGWRESMEKLQGDAKQWLARTRYSSETGQAEKVVRVVILTKIWEVKGKELDEKEKERKKALESIGDGDIMQEEDSNLLKAVEEDKLLRSYFTTTRAKINVDSWVGAIHCVLHVWRWNNETDAPGCASEHAVLPGPEDGQDENSSQFALWKRDIFPNALDGEKKFVPDLNELRGRLEEARKKYALQRLLSWRDMYLDKKQGPE